eukprot:scpid10579/ scgid10458/ 
MNHVLVHGGSASQPCGTLTSGHPSKYTVSACSAMVLASTMDTSTCTVRRTVEVGGMFQETTVQLANTWLLEVSSNMRRMPFTSIRDARTPPDTLSPTGLYCTYATHCLRSFTA